MARWWCPDRGRHIGADRLASRTGHVDHQPAAQHRPGGAVPVAGLGRVGGQVLDRSRQRLPDVTAASCCRSSGPLLPRASAVGPWCWPCQPPTGLPNVCARWAAAMRDVVPDEPRPSKGRLSGCFRGGLRSSCLERLDDQSDLIVGENSQSPGWTRHVWRSRSAVYPGRCPGHGQSSNMPQQSAENHDLSTATVRPVRPGHVRMAHGDRLRGRSPSSATPPAVSPQPRAAGRRGDACRHAGAFAVADPISLQAPTAATRFPFAVLAPAAP